MTAVPSRELARKRPAEIVPNRPTVKPVDTSEARPLHLWRLAGWIATAIGAVLFFGFLLSLVQQAS
jgi:hypothetical protein